MHIHSGTVYDGGRDLGLPGRSSKVVPALGGEDSSIIFPNEERN